MPIDDEYRLDCIRVVLPWNGDLERIAPARNSTGPTRALAVGLHGDQPV